MTWEKLVHTCRRPFLLSPPWGPAVGSVWRCDAPGCGKRWRVAQAAGHNTMWVAAS